MLPRAHILRWRIKTGMQAFLMLCFALVIVGQIARAVAPEWMGRQFDQRTLELVSDRWAMFSREGRLVWLAEVELADGRRVHARTVSRYPAFGWETVRLHALFAQGHDPDFMAFMCRMYPTAVRWHVTYWEPDPQPGAFPWTFHDALDYDCRDRSWADREGIVDAD